MNEGGGRRKGRARARARCLAVRDGKTVQRDAGLLGPVGAADALRRAAARVVVVHVDAAVAEGGAVPHERLALGVVDGRAAAVAVVRVADDVRLVVRVDVRELPAAGGAGEEDGRGGEDGRDKGLHGCSIFFFLFLLGDLVFGGSSV